MGALSLEMTGSGSIGDLEPGWTVVEEATPSSVGDTGGGTGMISTSAVANSKSVFIVDNDAVVSHDNLGTYYGIVDSPAVTEPRVSFTIAPLASLLTVERTAPPAPEQPLATIIASYVSMVTDRLTIDYQASQNGTRTFKGWKGDVWLMLKALCAVERLEIVFTGTTIVIRDIGSVDFDFSDNGALTITPSTRGTAQKIPVICYGTKYLSVLGQLRYNYSTNPSVEINATGWSVLPFGSSVVTASARDTAAASKGVASYSATVTSEPVTLLGKTIQRTAVTFIHTVDITAVATGTLLAASMAGRADPAAGAGSPTARISDPRLSFSNYTQFIMVFKDIGGVEISRSYAQTGAAAATKWDTKTISGVQVPGGAVTAELHMQLAVWQGQLTGGPSPVAGTKFYADCAFLSNGTQTTYADGTTAGWNWSGTAQASTSFIPTTLENAFYDAKADNNTIYTVDAGEHKEFIIQTENSPTLLVTPKYAATVDIGIGEFWVSDANGLYLTEKDWSSYGGNISVAIGEEPGTIKLVLDGPTEIPGAPGPYSLSADDGQEEYATLSIAGTGVIVTKTRYEHYTGADPAKTPTEFAAEIDVPFIDSPDRMYSAVAWAAVEASGPTVTLTGRIKTADVPKFGLLQGMVISHKGSRYRITNATIGRVETTFTAQWFVTAGKADAVWASKTCAQFDALWAGDYTTGDTQIKPLMEAW